jgi:hypothetical protein
VNEAARRVAVGEDQYVATAGAYAAGL